MVLVAGVATIGLVGVLAVALALQSASGDRDSAAPPMKAVAAQSDRATLIDHLRGQRSTARERAGVSVGTVGLDRADGIEQLSVARPATTSGATMDRADAIQYLSESASPRSLLAGLDRADAIDRLQVVPAR
jgi:hypothetical protein